MNAHLPLSDQTDPAAFGQAALRRQVERLDALAEAGLELARAVGRQGEDGSLPPVEAARAFARVARAVRLAGLLQAKLIKDMEDLRRRTLIYAPLDEKAARLAEARARAEADPANGHKVRVERIVERQIKAKHRDDEEEVERLMTEACERLDDEDIYRDVLTRPVGELVALICRDLGVEPDWPKLAEEAWARDEIESGVPSSPFSNLDRARPPSFAAANGGGGPLAERSEERVVVGESRFGSFFDGPS